jgi:hypothetical protein
MSSDQASKKPADTPFKQQRLAAWQPILAPMYVVGCFIAIAAAFIPIGAAVLVATGDVVEVEVKYSNPVCTWGSSPKILDPRNINGTSYQISTGCIKTITFTIDRKLTQPVYMYYKLTNFYQNHRRYANSRYDTQIAGDATSSGDVGTTCDPFKGTPSTEDGRAYLYSPCGLIAWSAFNDSVALYKGAAPTPLQLICNSAQFTANGTQLVAMPCQKGGIAWDSDRDRKFRPPSLSAETLTGFGRPTDSKNYFVRNGYYYGEAGHSIPLTVDEDLMVWMRTASLPTFRKLWRRINVDMDVGKYTIVVTDKFDISAFSGEKSIIFATTSWIGGKNEFLGVAYIVVGSLCFVLAVAFFIKHKISGDRSGDAANMFRDSK